MIDNSDLYFNMCDKAEEIQAIFEKNRVNLKDISHVIEIEKTTWMPSQEQLQGMVKNNDLLLLLRDFILFVKQCFQTSTTDKNKLQFTSMQQLWLAYVMKKNYNKAWNNIRWIEIK